MANYADLPDYVNNLVKAAIDAHMRERFLFAAPIPVVDGFYRICDMSTSPAFIMNVACPDASGNGGGESSFYDLGPLAEYLEEQPGVLQEYDQTHQFAYLRARVHQIIEGDPWTGGVLKWTELPRPSGFDDTISALGTAIGLLSVDDAGNFITRRVADIKNTFNRADASGTQLPGTDPMSGDFVQALRLMLTGDPSDDHDKTPGQCGQLITFCKGIHDYLVVLDSLLRAERGVWESARQDVADVVCGAVDQFNGWWPLTSISLSELVAGLALAGDLLALTGPGAGVGAFFGILADLGSVAMAFNTNTTMSIDTAKFGSVEELLGGFERSLNAWSDSDGARASVNQGIFARELDLYSDSFDLSDSAPKAKVIPGNQDLLLSSVDSIKLSTGNVTSGDLDGLVTVAALVGQVAEELKTVAKLIRSVADSASMLAWHRPGGIGYVVFDAEYGPFRKWNDFAGAIINLTDDAGVDLRPTVRVLLQIQKLITDYRDKVEQCDLGDAHACDAIKHGW
ncbi:MAG: hypothetical protein FWD63_05100 [Propionibacteriaceae bacterium]|nr:hypothetical protein [Propionibacteriaceae bacterium]